MSRNPLPRAPQTAGPRQPVDLYGIGCQLYRHKRLLMAAMAVGALIAAAYVWFSTPIYRATTRILSPDAASLISYNVASMLTGPATIGVTGNKDATVGIPELTVNAAYSTFQRHLSSEALRLAFFQQTYLPAIGQTNPSEPARNKLWQRFNHALEVTPPGPHDNAIVIALSGTRPDLIATLLTSMWRRRPRPPSKS